MKNLVFLFLFQIAISAIAKDNVHIRFQVKNGCKKKIVVKVFDNYITRDTWIYRTESDSNGYAQISFKLDRPREALFIANGNNFMFLSPGDNLKINFDYNNTKKTIEYLGKGADHCNFYKEWNLKFHDRKIGKDLIRRGLSNEEYTDEINKRWKERRDFYNAYIVNHKVSEPFKYWAQGLVDYSSIKEHLILFLYVDKTGARIKNPKDYYSFISEDYFRNDSVLKYSQAYLSAVSFYIPICRRILKQDTIMLAGQEKLNGFDLEKEDSLSVFYKEYYCYFEKGDTRNSLIARYLLNTYGDDTLSDSNYNDFKMKCSDEQLLFILSNALAKYKDAEIPEEILKTELISLKGRKLSFKQVLRKHKGKVIYIDFWSTFCRPCIKELPFLDSLVTDFTGLPIEVISLSLDNEYSRWKSFVEKSNLEIDNQYLIKKSFQSELCEFYSINSIPRFFIIDPKLRLVTSKAQRPSNIDLKKYLILEMKNFELK